MNQAASGAAALLRVVVYSVLFCAEVQEPHFQLELGLLMPVDSDCTWTCWRVQGEATGRMEVRPGAMETGSKVVAVIAVRPWLMTPQSHIYFVM